MTKGTVAQFKCALDKHLATLDDELQLLGYTQSRGARSISIIDMCKLGSRAENLVSISQIQEAAGGEFEDELSC